jgi:hypothetical protein
MGKRFCWRTENCGRGSDLKDTMPLMKDWKNWVPRRVPYLGVLLVGHVDKKIRKAGKCSSRTLRYGMAQEFSRLIGLAL